MSTRLLTFGAGSSRFPRAAHRVAREARRSGSFERAEAITAGALRRTHPEFAKRHAAMLNRDVRGFGYWIWKPLLIDAALRSSDTEFVAYVDAGSVLNLAGTAARQRFAEYHEIAAQNGLLVMQSRYEEQAWCKADTLERIGVPHADRTTGQIEAGFLLLNNTATTRDLVRSWLDLCCESGYHHLDDSPSQLPNAPSFNEHRHDQAILSCLCKVAAVPTIPNETDFPSNWETTGANFPIWSARHRWGTRFEPNGSDSWAHRMEERIDDVEIRFADRRAWATKRSSGVSRGVFLDGWAGPRVTRDMQASGRILVIRGRMPSEHKPLVGQRLAVWCNGELMARRALVPGPFAWELDLPEHLRGLPIRVQLHASRSFVPKRTGLNGDIRRLSYYLDELTVAEN